MIITKLYSNFPKSFSDINFNDSVNVILAEIRVPQNFNKDTHNLGKTTLGNLIDFMLFRTKHPDFFLFKHYEIFKDFEFYLEIKIDEDEYLTLKRSVKNSSKISVKTHNQHGMSFLDLDEDEWNHWELPFARAKALFDGILDLEELKPWGFRKAFAYLLRGQKDYSDVFKLNKFQGKEMGWKPFLNHILGFNSELSEKLYKSEEDLEEKQEEEKIVKRELGEFTGDISRLEGLLAIRHEEVESMGKTLDSFDLNALDKGKTTQLVNDIDERIASLNKTRYGLNKNKKLISESLTKEKVSFNAEKAKELFDEVGVLFPDSLKKDFNQLLEFNKSINQERNKYLKEELSELNNEIELVNSELKELGNNRSETINHLSDTDLFNRYKTLSNELVSLKASVKNLEDKRKFIESRQKLRDEIRDLSSKINVLLTNIEVDNNKQNTDKGSTFSEIRFNVKQIVKSVLDNNALLTALPNDKGHFQYKIEILNDEGNATSEDLGHTYRKLLCIAFDLALLKTYKGKKFPHFVYHDGVFEGLDKRKKVNLLQVLREYSQLGIQIIITSLDSEFEDLADYGFHDEEIVLKLHDEDNTGLLFKIPRW